MIITVQELIDSLQTLSKEASVHIYSPDSEDLVPPNRIVTENIDMDKPKRYLICSSFE